MSTNPSRVARPSTAAHRQKAAPVREGSAAPRPISAATRRPLSGSRIRSASSQSNSSLPATRPPTATTRLPLTRPPTAVTRQPPAQDRGSSPELESPVKKHVLNSYQDSQNGLHNPTPAASKRFSKVMKMKASQSTAHELMGEIYRLCEELSLGEDYTRELQAALETSATNLDSLATTRDELLSHKKVCQHVMRHIDVRERVLKCMVSFVHTHTGVDGSKIASPFLSEKEELNAFKRVSLSMVDQAEGESILGSLRGCTQTVHEALDMWVASMERLGASDEDVASGHAVRVSSTQSVRITRPQAAPKPEPRFATIHGPDYRRKMIHEMDKYARMQAIWGLPVVPVPAPDDPLNTSTSSTASSARLETLRMETENEASIAIQRVWRGKYGRMLAAYRRIRVRAATRIQTWFRTKTRIWRLTVRIGRSRAVRTIQSAWRASCRRQERQRFERHSRAALAIQRAFKVWSRHIYWQHVMARNALERAAASIIFRFLRRICFAANLNRKICQGGAAVIIQTFVRKVWAKRSNDAELSDITNAYSRIAPCGMDVSQPLVPMRDEASYMYTDNHNYHQRTPSQSSSRAPDPSATSFDGISSRSFTQASLSEAQSRAAMNITTPAAMAHANESFGGASSSSTNKGGLPKMAVSKHLRVYPQAPVSPNSSSVYNDDNDGVEEEEEYFEEEEDLLEYEEGEYNDDGEEEREVEVPLPLACRRVRSVPVAGNQSRIVFEEQDVPASRLHHNFWRGDAECAVSIQTAYRSFAARKLAAAKRLEKLQRDRAAAELKHQNVCARVVQMYAQVWIATFVISRRCPLQKVAAVRIQRWWRRWAGAPITTANRHHRDYLDELDKFAGIMDDKMKVGFTDEQARFRKKCAVRLSTWTKKHLNRQKTNYAAQQTIARAWRHYLCQRTYCLKKYHLRMERARQAAAEVARLELIQEEKRKGAALVILYYYSKWRLRTLVFRLDRVCDEVRSRPDRQENAKILQKFWRISVAKLDTMKRRRIAAQERERTAQEEQLFNAALRIQALYRQVKAKRCVEDTRRRIKEDRNYAVEVIQRNARMWLAKIRSDEMRLGHLSMYQEFRRLLTRKQYRSNQL